MSRPFRLRPPAPPAGALARAGLIARVEERWSRRLVTVVAGPGFGKTSLVAAAMAATEGDAGRRDVWLGCEPADRDPDRLLEGIGAALSLTGATTLERICDEVWADAPRQVCLVFDDVHELPATSAAVEVLRGLVADLPANGHLVLVSRDPVPVPTARLAASGQLVRLRETDLLFSAEELTEFARGRGVDDAVLASCAGWPALAELAASAGQDLVADYLWDEVLARLGDDRSARLARLAVAGSADDAVIASIEGADVRVGDVVAGVPLVRRSVDGTVSLHPLWGPPLSQILTPAEADRVRREAASVHRRAGREDAAIELLVEAAAWPEVLDVMRDAAIKASPMPGLSRWYRDLPDEHRDAAPARFAAAMDARSRSSRTSLPLYEAAADAFRADGDIDGEVAAIVQEGIVRWWGNDIIGIFRRLSRVRELAALGSRSAAGLDALAQAAVFHSVGDSNGVFDALTRGGEDIPSSWAPSVAWFESVAHRRNGDLAAAAEVFDRREFEDGYLDLQSQIARIRIAWLRGEVDEVVRDLREHRSSYAGLDEFLHSESTLELASKTAWLGEEKETAALLAELPWSADEAPGAVHRILQLITHAATSVVAADEGRAAAMLADSADARPGRPESWYWRDRAALALPYVLVPEDRDGWAAEPLGPAHQVGLLLAQALVAARAGDLAPVRGLEWPAVGIVRAHLPRPWAVELAAVGHDAKNPPPHDLLDAIRDSARTDLRRLTGAGATPVIARAAKTLLGRLPVEPSGLLRVGVLGPLVLWRSGASVEHDNLRRQRVREVLCVLVARRRIRREELAELLWPDVANPGSNLRTTLSYLRSVLEPEHASGATPFFVRADGAWLVLTAGSHLAVDLWELDERLDEAERAEQANAPGTALAAYRSALPLWRGEPFADVTEGLWADAERARVRRRYTGAAVRAGELLMAAGETNEAKRAALRAADADPASEAAYQVLVRAHLADGDLAGATRALDACRGALGELGAEPSPTTVALLG